MLRGVVVVRDVFSKAQEVCSGGQILYWARERKSCSSSRVTLRSMVRGALGHTFLAFGRLLWHLSHHFSLVTTVVVSVF